MVPIPPATKPGVNSVGWLRQPPGRRDLQPARRHARLAHRRPTRRYACSGIGFTVLHNDRAGRRAPPAGGYKVSSLNMDCGTHRCSHEFLAGCRKADRRVEHDLARRGPGDVHRANSGLSFSVAKNREPHFAQADFAALEGGAHHPLRLAVATTYERDRFRGPEDTRGGPNRFPGPSSTAPPAVADAALLYCPIDVDQLP